ncbi:MAG: hypothetical protein DHS20C21_14670 [Gemmatimonadota bacterium]|nr:MAG: hypothetical protein DHS20C21_14670 [Gemmatimonadota bacterium]
MTRSMEGRGGPRAARVVAAAGVGFAASWFLAAVSPAQADVYLDAGAGYFSPFDEDHRAAYGASPAFLLGISSAVGNAGSRVFLEVEYVHASGSEFTPDPTFEDRGRATYDLVPLTLGARFDLNGNPDQDLRVFLGLGARSLLTRWEGAGVSRSSPTTGAFVELRPEFRAGDHWTLWIRQRLDLIANVDYGREVAPLSYSGSSLALGISISLDHAPLTPPRNDS